MLQFHKNSDIGSYDDQSQDQTLIIPSSKHHHSHIPDDDMDQNLILYVHLAFSQFLTCSKKETAYKGYREDSTTESDYLPDAGGIYFLMSQHCPKYDRDDRDHDL